MADEHGEKAEEKRSQSVAALTIAAIFIIIGLPLWWNTTKVYRAPLPYAEIQELGHQKISYHVMVSIVVMERVDRSVLQSFERELLQTLTEGPSESSSLKANYSVQVRLATKKEVSAVLQFRSSSLHDLDRILHKHRNSAGGEEGAIIAGHYSFVLLSLEKPFSQFAKPDVQAFVGELRQSIVFYEKDLKPAIGTIVSILQEVYVNKDALNKALTSSQERQFVKDDIESMRAQKSTTGFQVSFTLLNSDPSSVLVNWDIEKAVQSYLKPFLKKFPDLDITVDSQVLHYSSIRISPRKAEDIHYLRLEDLPHMINPIEAKLGSHVSLHPNVNFVVYVPSKNPTPLYIKDKSGKPVESNAFLSPQWGGVMIYNINPPLSNDTGSDSKWVLLDMESVMKVFIPQLKLLLGFLPVKIGQGIVVHRNAGVTQWEQDSLLRIKTMEYLATCTSTLTSLAQLLARISNMVIGDAIRFEVERAMQSLHQCHHSLHEGNLTAAFLQAKTAIISSEKAFFDPSVLALLYFPDDQKFAIYIPLFLPISFPVLLSLKDAFKWFRSGRNNETKAKKKRRLKQRCAQRQ